MATKTDLLYINVNSDISTGGFNKNFLLINAGAIDGVAQQTSYFSKPAEDTDWSNVPDTVKNRAWIGLRTVMRRSQIHAMVKIEEMYPVAGRIWYNFHNSGTWTGWKNITPS